MATPTWYLDYLSTPRWQAIRRTMLCLAQHRCRTPGCWQRRGLQVHHLSYANLGNEFVGDLTVLCRNCHERAHNLPITPYRGRHDFEILGAILKRLATVTPAEMAIP